MDEYIEKQKAVKEIRAVQESYQKSMSVDKESVAHRCMVLVSMITPSDVVPVVRCKDCVYSGVHGESILFCENFERDMMPDDFCSLGTRMDGAEE